MAPSKNAAPKLSAPSPQLIAELAQVVGDAHAITNPDDQRPYLVEWRDLYEGRTPVVVRPNTTDQVSKIVQLANEAGVGIVPQSGNTGLVGGQIPSPANTEILLSLSRLTRVRSIAPSNQTMVVEAGLTLAEVQSKAQSLDHVFPLSMASQGSCQIGGNLATNAGGVSVLAYGCARDLVLGLEVVLADGTIWNGLRTLKKDNTGYDLKNMFIGSEGTLGIITAAAIKLFPRPTSTATALVALDNLDAIARLFNRLSRHYPHQLTAFEFIPEIALDFVTRHIPGCTNPIKTASPWYALIEFSQFNSADDATNQLEQAITDTAHDNLIRNGVVANSLKQSAAMWRLRESISEAQKHEGGSIKHDISVPIDRIPFFIESAAAIVEGVCSNARPVPFGHFGDGNIHYNISQPVDMDRNVFLNKWEAMSDAIHGLVANLNGSISAEHGIGQMKRAALQRYKDPVELQLMRTLKRTLDPRGILNPGKLL